MLIFWPVRAKKNSLSGLNFGHGIQRHTKMRKTERFYSLFSVSYTRYVWSWCFCLQRRYTHEYLNVYSALIHKQRADTYKHIATLHIRYSLYWFNRCHLILHWYQLHLKLFVFPPNKSAAFCLLAHIPPIHPSFFIPIRPCWMSLENVIAIESEYVWQNHGSAVAVDAAATGFSMKCASTLLLHFKKQYQK